MKYLQADTVFEILIRTKRNTKMIVCYPVNGEVHFNDVGFSAGIVHFADPLTKENLGWCGVQYFEDNANAVEY